MLDSAKNGNINEQAKINKITIEDLKTILRWNNNVLIDLKNSALSLQNLKTVTNSPISINQQDVSESNKIVDFLQETEQLLEDYKTIIPLNDLDTSNNIDEDKKNLYNSTKQYAQKIEELREKFYNEIIPDKYKNFSINLRTLPVDTELNLISDKDTDINGVKKFINTFKQQYTDYLTLSKKYKNNNNLACNLEDVVIPDEAPSTPGDLKIDKTKLTTTSDVNFGPMELQALYYIQNNQQQLQNDLKDFINKPKLRYKAGDENNILGVKLTNLIYSFKSINEKLGEVTKFSTLTAQAKNDFNDRDDILDSSEPGRSTANVRTMNEGNDVNILPASQYDTNILTSLDAPNVAEVQHPISTVAITVQTKKILNSTNSFPLNMQNQNKNNNISAGTAQTEQYTAPPALRRYFPGEGLVKAKAAKQSAATRATNPVSKFIDNIEQSLQPNTNNKPSATARTINIKGPSVQERKKLLEEGEQTQLDKYIDEIYKQEKDFEQQKKREQNETLLYFNPKYQYTILEVLEGKISPSDGDSIQTKDIKELRAKGKVFGNKNVNAEYMYKGFVWDDPNFNQRSTEANYAKEFIRYTEKRAQTIYNNLKRDRKADAPEEEIFNATNAGQILEKMKMDGLITEDQKKMLADYEVSVPSLYVLQKQLQEKKDKEYELKELTNEGFLIKFFNLNNTINLVSFLNNNKYKKNSTSGKENPLKTADDVYNKIKIMGKRYIWGNAKDILSTTEIGFRAHLLSDVAPYLGVTITNANNLSIFDMDDILLARMQYINQRFALGISENELTYTKLKTQLQNLYIQLKGVDSVTEQPIIKEEDLKTKSVADIISLIESEMQKLFPATWNKDNKNYDIITLHQLKETVQKATNAEVENASLEQLYKIALQDLRKKLRSNEATFEECCSAYKTLFNDNLPQKNDPLSLLEVLNQQLIALPAITQEVENAISNGVKLAGKFPKELKEEVMKALRVKLALGDTATIQDCYEEYEDRFKQEIEDFSSKPFYELVLLEAVNQRLAAKQVTQVELGAEESESDESNEFMQGASELDEQEAQRQSDNSFSSQEFNIIGNGAGTIHKNSSKNLDDNLNSATSTNNIVQNQSTDESTLTTVIPFSSINQTLAELLKYNQALPKQYQVDKTKYNNEDDFAKAILEGFKRFAMDAKYKDATNKGLSVTQNIKVQGWQLESHFNTIMHDLKIPASDEEKSLNLKCNKIIDNIKVRHKVTADLSPKEAFNILQQDYLNAAANDWGIIDIADEDINNLHVILTYQISKTFYQYRSFNKDNNIDVFCEKDIFMQSKIASILFRIKKADPEVEIEDILESCNKKTLSELSLDDYYKVYAIKRLNQLGLLIDVQEYDAAKIKKVLNVLDVFEAFKLWGVKYTNEERKGAIEDTNVEWKSKLNRLATHIKQRYNYDVTEQNVLSYSKHIKDTLMNQLQQLQVIEPLEEQTILALESKLNARIEELLVNLQKNNVDIKDIKGETSQSEKFDFILNNLQHLFTNQDFKDCLKEKWNAKDPSSLYERKVLEEALQEELTQFTNNIQTSKYLVYKQIGKLNGIINTKAFHDIPKSEAIQQELMRMIGTNEKQPIPTLVNELKKKNMRDILVYYGYSQDEVKDLTQAGLENLLKPKLQKCKTVFSNDNILQLNSKYLSDFEKLHYLRERIEQNDNLQNLKSKNFDTVNDFSTKYNRVFNVKAVILNNLKDYGIKYSQMDLQTLLTYNDIETECSVVALNNPNDQFNEAEMKVLYKQTDVKVFQDKTAPNNIQVRTTSQDKDKLLTQFKQAIKSVNGPINLTIAQDKFFKMFDPSTLNTLNSIENRAVIVKRNDDNTITLEIEAKKERLIEEPSTVIKSATHSTTTPEVQSASVEPIQKDLSQLVKLINDAQPNVGNILILNNKYILGAIENCARTRGIAFNCNETSFSIDKSFPKENQLSVEEVLAKAEELQFPIAPSIPTVAKSTDSESRLSDVVLPPKSVANLEQKFTTVLNNLVSEINKASDNVLHGTTDNQRALLKASDSQFEKALIECAKSKGVTLTFNKTGQQVVTWQIDKSFLEANPLSVDEVLAKEAELHSSATSLASATPKIAEPVTTVGVSCLNLQSLPPQPAITLTQDETGVLKQLIQEMVENIPHGFVPDDNQMILLNKPYIKEALIKCVEEKGSNLTISYLNGNINDLIMTQAMNNSLSAEEVLTKATQLQQVEDASKTNRFNTMKTKTNAGAVGVDTRNLLNASSTSSRFSSNSDSDEEMSQRRFSKLKIGSIEKKNSERSQ